MSKAPFIIPAFMPQAGCPHQCVFCNQEAITGVGRQNFAATLAEIRETVARYLSYRRDNERPAELAFFGGNFLGLPAEQITQCLDIFRELCALGYVESLRFSTRPDTVTPETLALLQGLPVAVAELGAQSMHDEVLRLSGRGHTALDTVRSVALLQNAGIKAGLQLMLGLPGDTPERALATAQMAVALKPVCVRIYPCLVIKGSPLAQLWAQGLYTPLSLGEAVELTADLYRVFTLMQISVIRMGLQATDDLQPGSSILAGPYHPSFGHLVYSRLFLRALRHILKTSPPCHDICVTVHPGQVSHLRGLNNANTRELQARYPQIAFTFKTSASLLATQLQVNGLVTDIINIIE